LKSKANIKGHPLHPILVSFPIAFFTGGFLLDVVSLSTGKDSYAQAAVYSVTGGLIFAVIAAIPGIIDYYYTVPSKSSAKKRAAKHGLINVAALLVFTVSLFLRFKNDTSLAMLAGIEGVGVALVTVAGWLGGTLVTRNQISIDHRYAHAGKWLEKKIRTTGKSISLGDLSGLKVDQMRLYRVNGQRIVVGRTETAIVAFSDFCTHRGGSLADGVMICGTVQCPWHGSQFDVKTGAVKAGPAKANIRTYEVRVEGGEVFLSI
jgi:uncharacterized membrane protein/nitrite reductase/ring-hydroxylating ferredoxin subunit